MSEEARLAEALAHSGVSDEQLARMLLVRDGTFLRALVGSTAHGLNLPGTDDRDEMGIALEPPGTTVGLLRFEHFVKRTQPDGVRSGPGDLDLTIYSLRKWARLAMNGNPSVLLLLFVPKEHAVVWSPLAEQLQAHAWAFASKKAVRAFLGYLQAQRQRMVGERGQKDVKRPELVEAHGYDVKYAAHVIRLGYQGIEYAATGKLTLPMPDDPREFILAIRRGEVDENEVLTRAGEIERELEDALVSSPLPDEPDSGAVNSFLIASHLHFWKYTPHDDARFACPPR